MKSVSSNWSGGGSIPALSQSQWNVMAVPAAVLAVMAILQLVSFGKFKDWLDAVGVASPAAAAVIIIIAELWGSASFLRAPMSSIVRNVGMALAVLVTGFWFVKNLQLVGDGSADATGNSGFFGKFLAQTPGWWTVIEITILLFLVLYAVKAVRRAS